MVRSGGLISGMKERLKTERPKSLFDAVTKFGSTKKFGNEEAKDVPLQDKKSRKKPNPQKARRSNKVMEAVIGAA